MRVVLPPQHVSMAFELARFGQRVDRDHRRRMHESRTLAALRDTLLPKLISGELRVKEAEKLSGRSIRPAAPPRATLVYTHECFAPTRGRSDALQSRAPIAADPSA